MRFVVVGAGTDSLKERVLHGEAGREPGRLLQQGHAQAAAPRDLAVVRGRGLGEDPQQGRLARAVRADEPDPLLLVDGEVDPLEQRPRAERRGQLLDVEEDRHR